MTEYDFSPNALERHLATQHRIAQWVENTEQHRDTRQLKSPNVPPSASELGDDDAFPHRPPVNHRYMNPLDGDSFTAGGSHGASHRHSMPPRPHHTAHNPTMMYAPLPGPIPLDMMGRFSEPPTRPGSYSSQRSQSYDAHTRYDTTPPYLPTSRPVTPAYHSHHSSSRHSRSRSGTPTTYVQTPMSPPTEPYPMSVQMSPPSSYGNFAYPTYPYVQPQPQPTYIVVPKKKTRKPRVLYL
jgi:hypothetical protein